MFGSIGISELIFIAAVGLLVLGPEQFPKYAKMAARFMRDLKNYANEVQTEIVKELNPLNKELTDLKRISPEKYLDKLIADDIDDKTPPNPEPHPSEVNFGTPAPVATPEPAPPAEEQPKPEAAAPAATVAYGSASGGYPQEPDVPPTPPAFTQPKEPERLDG
jgi:sec-independent protein translocase protein TatB